MSRVGPDPAHLLPTAARARLVAADQHLEAHAWGRRSLAPGREQSRSLLDVCAAAAGPEDDPEMLVMLATGLAELARTQQESFPDNLCCDFDLLVADAVRHARASSSPAAVMRARLTSMCSLQRLYGSDTAIRFRYVHDFVYGFDWAKWVARDPDLRAMVGPFDPMFLDHLERRAHVLLGLIADDDAVYGSLPDDHARNPFPFSREPDAELTLHRDLARRGLVPVAAWDPQAHPTWQRAFAALRVEQAAALGLAVMTESPS